MAKLLWLIVFFGGTLNAALLRAQQNPPDKLFEEARILAFKSGDFSAAIERCKLALETDTSNNDIRIFLAHLYFWNGHPDSSISHINLLIPELKNEQSVILLISRVYNSLNHFDSSLHALDKGLQIIPNDPSLVIAKLSTLLAAQDYRAGYEFAKLQPPSIRKEKEFRVIHGKLKESLYRNELSLSYDYTNFKKQFEDPWTVISIGYTRNTRIGSVSSRLRYGNRYGSTGYQAEIEAYPKISKTFYGHISAGWSKDFPIFPKINAGASLTANLPKAFETEVGFRYLKFEKDSWLYTIAIGKYLGNFWINGKTYMGINNASEAAYTLQARYYFKDARNLLGLSISSGISPDDRTLNQLDKVETLGAQKLIANYKFSVGSSNSFSIEGSLASVEYLSKLRDTQSGFVITYNRRF